MNRIASVFLALTLVAGVVAPIAAAPCKDAKGRFIKCPPPKPVGCKDAKGRFIKCPPAKAVPCKDRSGKFASCSAPGAQPIR